MYLPFEELPSESRVWIYTGTRAFTQAEEKSVSDLLESFCAKWAAHGEPLRTSYKIERNQFIVMALDENFQNPSGCSIDSSVGVLRQIQTATGIDFLDRSAIPFLINNRVVLVPLSNLKARFASGDLRSDTLTFHTLAATKGEWESANTIPVEKSWLAKYLPKTALTQ
ncbi:MAG: hypothetical protein JNM78_14910 [Cyclobacteriaceae bacterium]|nr:hypothetical protein [Cyclobacteriaceae bacterium]